MAAAKNLSAYKIAELLGRHPVSVYEALQRFRIKPCVEIQLANGKTQKGYPRKVVGILRKKMRNAPSRKHEAH